jgi:hypothetical protein
VHIIRRVNADTLFRFIIWLISFLVENACEKMFEQQVLFWVVFSKDMVCACSTIAIIVVVQWGIMNSCACWSGWGATWVHLPQLPEVKVELMFFIRHVAPWIVAAALAFHLFFCAAVVWKYRDAVRVLVQRDDGLSNLDWKMQRETKDHVHVREREVGYG